VIQQLHEMLCQEPWCGFPDKIAGLTDWQIENLYALPAIERMERMERERGTGNAIESNETASLSAPPDPNSPGFRGWVIKQFITMGMSRATAEKMYEEQSRSR
jgi:hypothetical protein